MITAHETSQEVGEDNKPTHTIPANSNICKVIELPTVESGLTVIESKLSDLDNASLARVKGSIAELRMTLTNIRAQLVASALEAVKRADGRVQITGQAPEVSESRDLQPGQMAPGKGIFIGEFDLADAWGSSLGIRTRWYDTAIELSKPMTFNDTERAVADNNANGRGGLHLDPTRYEADLFEKLKTGEALGKNVIAPLEVVKAIYSLRNTGEYKRLSEGDLPGKTDGSQWQWSCTTHRNRPDDRRVVGFTDGRGGWIYRDDLRMSGRVCFAELAL